MHCLNLTKPAWGLWKLHRLWELLTNTFANITSLTQEVDISPRQHEVSLISYPDHSPVIADNLGLSLPSDHAFNHI